MQFTQIQPVLPARDVAEAIDYYVEKLGFELAFKYPEDKPEYVGIRRDNVSLHLQWHAEESFEKVERLQLRFVINNVDELFEEYKIHDLMNMNENPIITDWGTYEFSFYDLNMNGLFFYQDS